MGWRGSVRTSSFGPKSLALLESLDTICANLSAVLGDYRLEGRGQTLVVSHHSAPP